MWLGIKFVYTSIHNQSSINIVIVQVALSKYQLSFPTLLKYTCACKYFVQINQDLSFASILIAHILMAHIYGTLMKYIINLTRMLGMNEGWYNKLTGLLDVISVGCIFTVLLMKSMVLMK